MEDPIADSNASNDLFTRDDKLGGIAFPPGTRSVLFVGTHGTGPPCYGAGTSEDPPPNGACHNPLTGSQGEHSYPYRGQVWAYDANDLARVREGDLDPWKVRPYAVWPLPGVSEETTRVMRGGVTFDPETRRLYLAEDYGEFPRVHVFTIAQPQGQ
jgi:hypothetical protein